MRWTVLVPLRALPAAKSRLAASVPPDTHARLVAAIRADTVQAARQAAAVARVILIGDVPGDGITLVQHSAGLNGALRDGAAYAIERWPDDGVAALVGDLPALRAGELDAALAAAAAHPRGFVADAHGTGTTLLTATPGTALEPRFGSGSARRHATSAAPLPAGPGLRTDVDTLTDLAAAARLGLGAHTAALDRGVA
ncbi:MAG TPA: 2-phospho-L-lactate guanylyltransferase [Jatrophihabitantaceae bacterium]|jgi:2-phospho-L-lactate guanylyltransferase